MAPILNVGKIGTGGANETSTGPAIRAITGTLTAQYWTPTGLSRSLASGR